MKPILIHGRRNQDVGLALVRLLLIMDIELELRRVSIKTAIGCGIGLLLDDGVPVLKIAEDLYSQSRDNRPVMARAIGEGLLLKIEKLCQQ